MTVIEFGKRDLKINFLIASLVVALVFCAGWWVVLYNNLIGLRHDVKETREMLSQARVHNAELKNELYHITDSVLEEAFFSESGLVLDQNPQYVKMLSVVSHVNP